MDSRNCVWLVWCLKLCVVCGIDVKAACCPLPAVLVAQLVSLALEPNVATHHQYYSSGCRLQRTTHLADVVAVHVARLLRHAAGQICEADDDLAAGGDHGLVLLGVLHVATCYDILLCAFVSMCVCVCSNGLAGQIISRVTQITSSISYLLCTWQINQSAWPDQVRSDQVTPDHSPASAARSTSTLPGFMASTMS